ncbi:MAG: sigma-70 family RNA polymerase sigma factor [Acidobacteria bacterium]|nr:sigma-70 family RNA polymerase sigma factor [Acidobacteriota bacterium]MCA1641011.1 sigma-70 family RNA polymerase sigma factor [Acidobacteriota bacterium]
MTDEGGSPQGVTQLLERWRGGDEAALGELLPLVEQELRRLARAYMRRERADHTLQPTALVNEAYLRMIDQRGARWQNRAQFFGVAAQLMRRVLVDHARARRAQKRGGTQFSVSLCHADGVGLQPDADLLAVHEALEELAKIDPQQERVVELRFFGGLSIEETAEALGVGHATVEREWKMARAWLRGRLT